MIHSWSVVHVTKQDYSLEKITFVGVWEARGDEGAAAVYVGELGLQI